MKNAGLDVVGMDDSEKQILKAKEDYKDIQFVKGDACNFKVAEPKDIVFSNAVFHWINKERQPDMLRCVFEALKPGGQFVFEMGRKGNNALTHGSLRCAFEKRGLEYCFPFYFPAIGDYACLMESAGFLVHGAMLFDRKTRLEGEDGLYDWIKMFVKQPFEKIDAAESEQIIRDAVEELRPRLCKDDVWYADYVRLRCKAVNHVVERGERHDGSFGKGKALGLGISGSDAVFGGGLRAAGACGYFGNLWRMRVEHQ